MEVVTNAFKRLSLRELCYVCLCIVVLYLFRAKDSYYLIPTWRKRSQPHHFNNGKFPTSEEYLPTPVVTDLESDGLNEVVMVTVDGRLSVLVLPEQGKMDDGSLPHVVVKNDVELQLTRPDGYLARPVVLETGFTVPYQSMMQIRKQVIVIVTDDWHVMCFDPDLILKWEVTLPNRIMGDELYQVKSLGVLITSHSVQKNDGGLIIIGGNFMHKTHHTKELPVETVDHEGNKTQGTKTVVEEVENLTHFSTFALSSANGTIRWHHLPGDFGEQQHNIQDQETEHHWKLGLRKTRKHVGESPWKMYSQQLNQHMPFMWVNNQHTKFTLGRFTKDKLRRVPPSTTQADMDGDEEPVISRHQSALSAQHLVGYAYGGQRPHSESEHASNPNAVVIRGPQGIEVLNLLSGQPITRLDVTETKHIHFDVDKDGEPENLVWDLGKGHTACYLDIWRVAPVKEKLEQLSLCISQRIIWQHSWAMEEDVFNRVHPVLVKSVAKKSGVLRHLLGQHLMSDEEEYDLITFGAVGRMSSLDLSGNIHWQVQTPCKWSELSIKLRRKSIDSVPQDIEDEFMQAFSPNFILMPLQVADRKDVSAVVGWNSLALVDLVDGTLLAEHSIPSPPTGPLAYGDFDNDGINDVILVCKKGFIGFTVKHKANYEYTIIYATAVLLTIIFVTWILVQPSEIPSTDER